ncbi:hypothetical protein FOZ60_011508, partial [Perkinsus olseni]
ASEMSVVGIGKVPLCSTLCHNVLAQCPGFNLNDVSGPCDSSSVPPVCAMAHFYRVDDMPQQYTTFDEYEPFSDKCPPFDPTLVFAGDHSLLEAIIPPMIRLCALTSVVAASHTLDMSRHGDKSEISASPGTSGSELGLPDINVKLGLLLRY